MCEREKALRREREGEQGRSRREREKGGKRCRERDITGGSMAITSTYSNYFPTTSGRLLFKIYNSD